MYLITPRIVPTCFLVGAKASTVWLTGRHGCLSDDVFTLHRRYRCYCLPVR